MMLFFIRENSHRFDMCLIHGIHQSPLQMSAWTIIKILLGGPLSLLLGMIVTLRDQPRRHRAHIELVQHNVEAYLSNKTIDQE